MKRVRCLKVYLILILILQISNLIIAYSPVFKSKHYSDNKESVQQIDLPPNLLEIIPSSEIE